MTVKNALSIFRERNGRHPVSLVAIEPILREITRSECRISDLGPKQYLVELYIVGEKIELELDYSVGLNGELEKFHVKNVRRHRSDG